jgi:hypothetical protein
MTPAGLKTRPKNRIRLLHSQLVGICAFHNHLTLSHKEMDEFVSLGHGANWHKG